MLKSKNSKGYAIYYLNEHQNHIKRNIKEMISSKGVLIKIGKHSNNLEKTKLLMDLQIKEKEKLKKKKLTMAS